MIVRSILVILLGSTRLWGQDPSFEVSVSGKQVVQNTVFEIQFELHNAQGDGFQPPDFHPFSVVGGPAMGSSTFIVNGQVSRSTSWSYSLLATREGKFTIPSAQVIAGRRKLNTRSVTIEVLKAEDAAKANPNERGGAIKLVAHVPEGEYYPGQQIVLEYKLVFSENIQSANIVAEDDYADFFVQPLNSYSREAALENINGVTFATRIIKAIGLFAHQSGNYTIEPMVLEVGIDAPVPGNQGFFSMRRLRNIQLVSEPVSINILPLPSDPSGQNNSGAIGQYEIKSTPPVSTQLSTDDDFSLQLQITGNGDARRWDPPPVATNGEFDLYDPRIIDDRIVDTEGNVMHTRTIEYVMIPQRAGEYSVYVPFRFFNPQTKLYETIYSDTIRLQVSQGNQTGRRSIILPQDSLAAFTPLTVNKITTDDRFWLSIPHLFLFGLLLTGTSFGLWKNYERRKNAALSPAEKIRSEALRRARHELDLLGRHKSQLADKAFFEKTTEIYTRFLEERFNIKPADLDEERIAVKFQFSGIPDSLQQEGLQFFRRCLALRYGAAPPGFSSDEMLAQSMHVIDALDKAAE